MNDATAKDGQAPAPGHPVRHASGDDVLVGCVTCYGDDDGSVCRTPEPDPVEPWLCRWCSHTVEPVTE